MDIACIKRIHEQHLASHTITFRISNKSRTLPRLHLEPDENNEDLFQRLMAFVDNLMTVDGGISHYDEFMQICKSSH